jgi:hypothetical protein
MAMFRVVKAPDSDESAYFLLCDHRSCMDARRGTAIVTNMDDYRLSKRQFLKAAIDEGWWIDLEGAFCPVHAREMLYAAREAEANGKKVVEARPEHISAFGKGRV